jgi:hypothetical protein
VELPFAFALILTGVGLLLMTPGFLKAAWMHMKLTLVLIAVILTHLKMFNAKRMVKAAMAGQNDELMARGKRQFVFGMLSWRSASLIGLPCSSRSASGATVPPRATDRFRRGRSRRAAPRLRRGSRPTATWPSETNRGVIEWNCCPNRAAGRKFRTAGRPP